MTPAGQLIRTARHAAGMTQRQLAERLGRTQASIAALERLDANPTVDTLHRVLAALDHRLELDAVQQQSSIDETLNHWHLRMTLAQRLDAFEAFQDSHQWLVSVRNGSLVSGPRDIDPRPALGLLTAHGVDFVVIGGLAAVLHGSAVYTKDIDVCYATDEGNLRALAKALIELEAVPREAPEGIPFVPDERTLRRVEVLTLDTTAGAVDVLSAPKGAPPYNRLRRNAVRREVGAFAVQVASIEDLITMKRATGRPRDAFVIEELETIRRLIAQGVGPDEES
jgi:transcriptional regulator with XRE-family HTH domain